MSTDDPRMDASGWMPDPTGRHEHRYLEDGRWSDAVADEGIETSDPAGAGIAIGDGAAGGVHGAAGASPGGPSAGSPADARARSSRPAGVWAGLGTAAVALGVGGFLVGRALTQGERTVPDADRPPVDRDSVVEVLDNGLYENFEGAINQEESACAARGVVDALGHERFLDLGLGGVNPYASFSFAELTADEEHTYLSRFLACIPDERLANYQASLQTSAAGVPAETARCIADGHVAAVGAARVRELLIEANFNPGMGLAELAEGDERDALAGVDAACEAASGEVG